MAAFCVLVDREGNGILAKQNDFSGLFICKYLKMKSCILGKSPKCLQWQKMG